MAQLWVRSSPGRAPPWHGGGSEFDPRRIHQTARYQSTGNNRYEVDSTGNASSGIVKTLGLRSWRSKRSVATRDLLSVLREGWPFTNKRR